MSSSLSPYASRLSIASSAEEHSLHSLHSLHSQRPSHEALRPLMDHKGETHGPSTASRLTAQMSYNVVSQPTAGQQFFALLIKNIRIRTRDMAQTL